MLKKDNPNKANITKLMKSRINELEACRIFAILKNHKNVNLKPNEYSCRNFNRRRERVNY
jgi:hypothetical protein